MGQLYARLIDEYALTRLVAVCGNSNGSTDALAGQYKVPGYSDGQHIAMLESHPQIDAVVVAASEWAHAEPAMAALDAGKHVLVEKPLAVSAEDAARIVAAADRSGRQLMVCHSLRFDPPYAAMQAAVAGGEIGEILNLYARRNPPQEAAKRVLGKFPLAYWLAPHDIDMMLWTVGSPIVKVKAFSRQGGKGLQDFILAVFTFANGAIGVLENAWGTPAHSGRPQYEQFTIRGTAGAAEVLGHENGVAVYRTDNPPTFADTGYTPVLHGRQEGMFRALFQHFIAVVRGEQEAVISGGDGLAAIRVAAAIDRSLQSGEEVAVEDGP